MSTIAFDVDGVLARTCEHWLQLYNRDYDDHLKPSDITSWDTHKFVKPECGTKIYEYLTPKLYKGVQPEPGGLEAVQYARSLGHRVIFATSVFKEDGAKFKWLKKWGFFEGLTHNPRKDYTELGDKNLLLGTVDLLIDDSPNNILAWTPFTNELFYDQPWNREFKTYKDHELDFEYHRAKTMPEVKEWIDYFDKEIW